MAIIYTYPAIGTPEDPDIMLISDVSLASNATRNITLSNLAAFINAKVDLSTAGDTGNGIVNLSTEILSVLGTANQIETAATNQTIQIGLPSTLIVPGTMNVVGTANFDSNVTMDIGLTVDDFLIADGNVRLLGPTAFGSNSLTVNGLTNLKGNAIISGTLSVIGDSNLTGTATTNAIIVNGVSTFNADASFVEKAEFQGAVADSQGSVGTAGQVLSSTVGGVQWVTDEGGNVTGTGTNLTAPMWFGASPTSNLANSPITFKIVDSGNINNYSLQFGGGSQAIGSRNSIAIGYANQATAEATLATGHGTIASGLHAASFNFSTRASGNKSAAFGNSTTASGTSSFAIGSDTIAATSLAFAGGLNSTANPSLNGTTAFAYGHSVNAFGPNSAVFGKQNSAQGENSFVAGGAGCIASGKNSLVIGNLSSAVQEKAIAIGDKNKAWAFGSIVIGKDSTAVSGKNNSIVLGIDLSASTDKQVVLGRNNKLTGASKFVVGNGIDANNRKNGLEITGSHVAIPDYGSGAVTGTATYNLSVDASGKIIETANPGGGGIGGSGTLNAIPMFTPDGNTIGDSPITTDGFQALTIPQYGSINFGASTLSDNLSFTNSLSGSTIIQKGSGTLEIRCDNEVLIRSNAGGMNGEALAKFSKDGSIELYYDNVKKFETTNNTIKILGVPVYADNSFATAAGLTVGEVYRTGDFLKIVH